MRIYLCAFGKLRTPGLRETADYYKKMIQPWVALEEVELKALAVPDKSLVSRSKIQNKEAELLLEALKDRLSSRGVLYCLDERGKALPTSTAKSSWSTLVTDWESQSIPELALCIGSSLGFGDAVREKAKGLFSLGPQTLSHELARVVLLEQLYRAWSVVRGHPYHVAE